MTSVVTITLPDGRSWVPKFVKGIDQEKCIGCGICTAKCPVQAIDGTFNALEVFAAAAAKKQKVTAKAV